VRSLQAVVAVIITATVSQWQSQKAPCYATDIYLNQRYAARFSQEKLNVGGSARTCVRTTVLRRESSVLCRHRRRVVCFRIAVSCNWRHYDATAHLLKQVSKSKLEMSFSPLLHWCFRFMLEYRRSIQHRRTRRWSVLSFVAVGNTAACTV